MAAELVVAPEAQQDIDEAYAWYFEEGHCRPATVGEFMGKILS